MSADRPLSDLPVIDPGMVPQPFTIEQAILGLAQAAAEVRASWRAVEAAEDVLSRARDDQERKERAHMEARAKLVALAEGAKP